jgi:BatD DUF11 like domain
MTNIDLFQKFIGLFFCIFFISFNQPADSPVSITLSDVVFSTDRPFTISVLIQNSETRPALTFPDILGLVKRGTTTSTTTNTDADGKLITNQLITQTYMAARPGGYRLAAFSITANGITARVEETMLTVQAAATSITDPTPITDAFAGQFLRESGTAFLSLQTSKTTVYQGEEFSLRLSLFVAENYPFSLDFSRFLEQQVQVIQKQIRPANAWEENFNIAELRPLPVMINNRKFAEYRIYEAAYFPLSARQIQIPAVSLTVLRVRPPTPATPASNTGSTRPTSTTAVVIRPAKPNLTKSTPGSPALPTESLTFLTRPLTIAVRPLPPHPLQAQVAVGDFRLVETLDKTSVPVGQSTRYTFQIKGEGNIAALKSPAITDPLPMLEILPGGTTETIERITNKVLGFKAFSFYIVPQQSGIVSLRDAFQWVFFNPKTARYDTLRPTKILRAGVGNFAKSVGVGSTSIASSTAQIMEPVNSTIYTDLNKLDSTSQPIAINVLVRAIVNVALVILLAGMIFVFFRQ